MEPMMKETAIPTYSCKPLTEKRIVSWTKKAIVYNVRLMALAGLFILSTSYQSHRNELLLMENDLFLPAFTDNLTGFFQKMSDTVGFANGRSDLRTIPLLKGFYSYQEFKPVWTSNTEVSEKAVVLLDLLDNAEAYGLESSLFPIEQIRNEMDRMGNEDLRVHYLESRMNLELLLTDACLQFLVYLKMGYREFDSSLFSLPTVANIPSYLNRALESDDFKERLLSVQPAFIEYYRLQKALERFLSRIERTDARITIPDPSEDSVLFRNVAENVLISLGYLHAGSTDEAYLLSLRKFQYYHGLEPDGKAGKNTREALAQSTEDKFKQIALNLDRLRKENLQAEHFIYVNIPAYQMKIYKMNKIIGNSRVIVGSPKTPTPLVNSKIERVITNPVWQVPRSITLNEMLPKLKSDSDYLSRNRLKLIDENRNTVAYDQVDWSTVSAKTFGLKLKQESGSDNALGRVKFLFPNPYSVYLHDTPGKHSFSNDVRALSHGCVRVQHPEVLAEYLVREFSNKNHDVEISDMINKGIRREITLDQPADLYIHYLTCVADEDYNIFFYKDIYGLDKKELKRLEFLQ
jgi:murein L,D-transpeptidase YcbB/YkuD